MDDTKGTGPGWERFEFDKDAPLDDEEIEGINFSNQSSNFLFEPIVDL